MFFYWLKQKISTQLYSNHSISENSQRYRSRIDRAGFYYTQYTHEASCQYIHKRKKRSALECAGAAALPKRSPSASRPITLIHGRCAHRPPAVKAATSVREVVTPFIWIMHRLHHHRAYRLFPIFLIGIPRVFACHAAIILIHTSM